VRFRGCICILITVAAAGAWLSASEFCPDLLLAGEQAVTLHTPIPDDELLPAELALLDRKLDPADAERRRLLDLYQGGFIELREMRRRATQVAARRKELQHKRTSLDNIKKQQLLRLLIEDVRVTGWHVQIQLRIALDPPPPEPPRACCSRHTDRGP
jgi:hypothetical protein